MDTTTWPTVFLLIVALLAVGFAFAMLGKLRAMERTCTQCRVDMRRCAVAASAS